MTSKAEITKSFAQEKDEKRTRSEVRVLETYRSSTDKFLIQEKYLYVDGITDFDDAKWWSKRLERMGVDHAFCKVQIKESERAGFSEEIYAVFAKSEETQSIR